MNSRSVFQVLAILLAVVATSARAETFVGSNIDSRVVVGLKANSEAVGALLPADWSSVPLPGGPLAGSNLLVVLIDGVLDMDPDGKPLEPASRRAAGLVGLGKKGDDVRMYVLRMMTTVPEREAYGVGVSAKIERSVTLSGPAAGARTSSDRWRIVPESGGEVTFTLDYTTGKRGWSASELFPHSASNPDFSRIYRYEQLADLVVSTAVGKPSSGTFALTSAGTEWDALLDGTEEIVGVLDVPVYVRKIFLP